jgi:signal transduction histidine kinase/CheY-like chemotaxis protein
MPVRLIAPRRHVETAVTLTRASLLLLLVLLGTPAVRAQSAVELLPAPRELLTTIQSIRTLSRKEAQRPYPVRVIGVVTHADSKIPDCFVQDETAGIYLEANPLLKGLVPGDRIAVEGVSNPGDFAPCILLKSIERLGKQHLPDPLPFDLSREESRWLDGQWVQVWGTITCIEASEFHTRLTLVGGNGTGTILLPDPSWAKEMELLRFASVRVRAVCVPRFSPQRTISGNPRLFTSSREFIKVLRTDRENQDEPIQLIDRLLGFTPEPFPTSRIVKIRGVITGIVPHGAIYVQDPTGVVGVETRSDFESPTLHLDDEIEAVGSLQIDGRNLHLLQATLRRIGQGKRPDPLDKRLGELNALISAGTRVQTQGIIEEIREEAGHPLATLREGASRIELRGIGLSAEEMLRSLPVQARIQVNGIYLPGKGSDNGGATRPVILFPSDVDLTVLERPAKPSWWTPNRIVVILGVIVSFTVLSLLWNAVLRRRLARQMVTAREAFSREAELEAKLKQSQKMEAVGRLAGGIAHDFNNLLTVINGCGELLKPSLAPKSPASELLNDILKAGEKAANLTSQLLIFSKHRVMQLAPMRINDAVREASNLLRRVIGDSIDLVLDYGDHLPPVLGEKGMIHQIVFNLAVNARDAMPKGGRLRIATSQVVDDISHWVRLTVSDNGTGMDAATQARVFEPFFTTKPMGQGTGLGLATVYGLVQSLNGRITFKSEVGYGTTFEIDLPPTSQPIAPSSKSNPVYPVANRKWQILVVEDDPAVQRFVQLALEQAGFSILLAENPHQALEICHDDSKHLDLLVTDMVMPEMSGKQLAEEALKLIPDLPILFISGYSPDELSIQGHNLEGWPFLQKPFPPSALAAKVKEMLNDSAHRLKPLR